MTTTHQTVNYAYDQCAPNIFSKILNMNLTTFSNKFGYMIIPVFKEDGQIPVSSNGYWYNNFLTYNLNSVFNHESFREYEYMQVPLMFDFHCKQLFDNGTLAKRFGDHDEPTLKTMYSNWLIENNHQLDIAKQCLSNTSDMSIPTVKKALSVVKYFDEQFNRKSNPIKSLRDYSYLSNLYIEPKDDERYDLSKYLVIVPPNVTDEELNKLYEQYPEYTTTNDNSSYIHSPGSKRGISNRDGFKNLLMFIIRVDKTLIMKMFQAALEPYKTHDQSYPEYGNGYSYSPTGTKTYHYVADSQLNQLSYASYDQIVSQAEQLINSNKLSRNPYEQGLSMLKELQKKEYVILRFGTDNNLITKSS